MDSINDLEIQLTKRLSMVSLESFDSAYGSDNSPKECSSAGGLVMKAVFKALGRQQSLAATLRKFVPQLCRVFAPTLPIDEMGLIRELGYPTDRIVPELLDTKILSEFLNQPKTALDTQIVLCVYRYLTNFQVVSVADLTRAGMRCYRISEFDYAFRWFEKAVSKIVERNRSASQALACLGRSFLDGLGVERNPQLALEYFIEAARNVPDSRKLQLLLFFVDKINTLQEHRELSSRAMMWLLEIANEGDYGPAQYLVGQCFYQGLYGFTVNESLARHYLYRAEQPKPSANSSNDNLFQWDIFR